MLSFLYLSSQESIKEHSFNIYAVMHNQCCPFYIYQDKRVSKEHNFNTYVAMHSQYCPFIFVRLSVQEQYWNIFAVMHHQSCPFYIYQVKRVSMYTFRIFIQPLC